MLAVGAALTWPHYATRDLMDLTPPRPVEDQDSDGLIALIGACFAEYPGCVLAVDEEMPEIRSLATWVGARDGMAWVVELEGEVVASVATHPVEDAWELKKLYVHKSARRRGLATRLVRLAETAAARSGATRMVLWTDTKFVEAHVLYEHLGYETNGERRELHDLSDTVEIFYDRRLDRCLLTESAL